MHTMRSRSIFLFVCIVIAGLIWFQTKLHSDNSSKTATSDNTSITADNNTSDNSTSSVNTRTATDSNNTNSQIIAKDPDIHLALYNFNVAISELCPVPKNNAPTWIELLNYGTTPVDAKGWILCDKTGVIYTIPRELPAIPAQGLILITFSGKNSPETDELVFAERRTARLYARNDNSLDAIRGLINECALYASPTPEPEMILDHACWGSLPDSPHMKAAVAIGLTTGILAKDDLKSVTIPPDPDIPVLTSGCGFARKLFEKPKLSKDGQRIVSIPRNLWDVYPSIYLTPGENNIWLPPILTGPHNNESTDWDKNGIIFSWKNPESEMPRKGRPNWQKRLQVAIDVNFTEFIVNELTETPYRLKPPLDPGIYYWRVRYETKEEETVWSEPFKFTIRDRM